MQSVSQTSKKLGWWSIFASRNWWEFAAAFTKLKGAQPISFLATLHEQAVNIFDHATAPGRGTCRPGRQEGSSGARTDARTPGRRRLPVNIPTDAASAPKFPGVLRAPWSRPEPGQGRAARGSRGAPGLSRGHRARCARTDGVPPAPEQKGET